MLRKFFYTLVALAGLAQVAAYTWMYYDMTDAPKNVIVWKFGDHVYMYGSFDHGVTDLIATHLDDNDTLVIGSGGGRTAEGYKLSELLRKYDTPVFIDDMGCYSSCSIAVAYQELSGPGVIGIHAVTFNRKQNFFTRWSDESVAEHYTDAGRDKWAEYMYNHNVEFKEFNTDD